MDDDKWTINRVVSVTKSHLRKPWLPQVKECDGKRFFKFEKFDRQVVMALTGKGLELRSSKEPHLLNSEAYDAIVKLRNDACTEPSVQELLKPFQLNGTHFYNLAAFSHLQQKGGLLYMTGPLNGSFGPHQAILFSHLSTTRILIVGKCFSTLGGISSSG